MEATLLKDAPSYATVKSWVAEFKRDKESLEDDPRTGRPVTVTTPEIVTKIHDMVMSDRRVTVRYIASAVEISQEKVHSILMEDLDMKKKTLDTLDTKASESWSVAHDTIYCVLFWPFLRQVLTSVY